MTIAMFLLILAVVGGAASIFSTAVRAAIQMASMVVVNGLGWLFSVASLHVPGWLEIAFAWAGTSLSDLARTLGTAGRALVRALAILVWTLIAATLFAAVGIHFRVAGFLTLVLILGSVATVMGFWVLTQASLLPLVGPRLAATAAGLRMWTLWFLFLALLLTAVPESFRSMSDRLLLLLVLMSAIVSTALGILGATAVWAPKAIMLIAVGFAGWQVVPELFPGLPKSPIGQLTEAIVARAGSETLRLTEQVDPNNQTDLRDYNRNLRKKVVIAAIQRYKKMADGLTVAATTRDLSPTELDQLRKANEALALLQQQLKDIGDPEEQGPIESKGRMPGWFYVVLLLVVLPIAAQGFTKSTGDRTVRLVPLFIAGGLGYAAYLLADINRPKILKPSVTFVGESPQQPVPPEATVRSYSVQGNQQWIEIPVTLTLGQKFKILAKGMVTNGPNGIYGQNIGPEGTGGLPYLGSFPAPAVRAMALAGRIGNDGTAFYAGPNQDGTPFTGIASKGGKLYLGCNDSLPEDNTGGWHVTVITYPVAN